MKKENSTFCFEIATKSLILYKSLRSIAACRNVALPGEFFLNRRLVQGRSQYRESGK